MGNKLTQSEKERYTGKRYLETVEKLALANKTCAACIRPELILQHNTFCGAKVFKCTPLASVFPRRENHD